MEKTFIVNISTDGPNGIDSLEIHKALINHFVAFVGIDVKEPAQQSVQRTRLDPHVECKVFVKTEHGYECEKCGKPPSR